ncbi:DUF1049 domain-containing protein [Skermania sp. ID1734]|uniref:LapA family protein n=1 Tax=Skermania sp. ID1734 TaxID=2597516 RepID=UPI00117E27CF|nr:lipopolysaccharide assembly protein LapA domain-containing protein [Skermania sp. ID1734]TSD93531.1 DUF1049 domain-containing protein [Skermania sp. ID1734]
MSTDPQQPPEEPGEPAYTPPVDHGKIKIERTRVSWAWTGLVVGIIVLILLLVFILQNLDTVQIHLYFWDVSLPLGVTVLLSAIVGALIMTVVGGARIVQIRRVAKRGPKLPQR